jgi:AcrR family transcriptional regulator
MAERTRREILDVARRLFAERGYAASSINDIAAEAGVAVQTIYARLGSKRGMLMALIDLIDEEADVGTLAAAIATAETPTAALRAEVRLTRVFRQGSGDIIGTLFAAAGTETELGDAVAEGRRRHRDGARVTVERIAALGGLRDDVDGEHAAALIALSTTYEAWTELIEAYRLSWDDAEQWLVEALGRAVVQPPPPAT